MKKVCCAIGYQTILADKTDNVKRELEREISEALSEGYRTFLTEFTEGGNLLFARCVSEQREQHPDIFLEAVLPTPAVCEGFGRSTWEHLSQCNGIKVLCDKCREEYPLSVIRNLTAQSSRVIVLYGEEPDHNTLFAMDYAQTMERELRIIKI
ncbi:MAG TPA: hypothetical protein DDZ65_05260 [Firmicutes bacterium]|nr:hypothetical protein [Bacillota bacterium]